MEENKKQEKTEKIPLGHKILTTVGLVLCLLLIPILIINCTLIVKSFANPDQVPSVGGMFPMIILTDSMSPEFDAGDLIICNKMDAEDVAVGDIICFYDPAGSGSTTVTHRVIEVTTDKSGNLAWRTQGDANNTADDALVPAENLVGGYKMCIPNAGNVAVFMQSTQGLIICIICPIVLLVAYDVIRRHLYDQSRKKETDALMAELEALRAEKAREKEE